VFADEGEGGLVGMVEPLAADLPVQPGDLRDGLLTAGAAALFAGEIPLGCREPSGGGRVVAGLGW
jgi:hypothetical protein